MAEVGHSISLCRLFSSDNLPVSSLKTFSFTPQTLVRRKSSFMDINNSPAYSRIPESPLFRLSFLLVYLASDRPGAAVLVYLGLQASCSAKKPDEKSQLKLEASLSTLRSLELEHITFCRDFLFPFLVLHSLIRFPAGFGNVPLILRENLQDVIVGASKEVRPSLLVFSLVSTPSSSHLT